MCEGCFWRLLLSAHFLCFHQGCREASCGKWQKQGVTVWLPVEHTFMSQKRCVCLNFIHISIYNNNTYYWHCHQQVKIKIWIWSFKVCNAERPASLCQSWTSLKYYRGPGELYSHLSKTWLEKVKKRKLNGVINRITKINFVRKIIIAAAIWKPEGKQFIPYMT